MQRQLTTTVYIFEEDRTLLHRHLKYGKWLPPGGHLEANETPPEAARREVFEEVGVKIEFLEQGPTFEGYNGKSFETPHQCILFNVPASLKEPAHQHIDFIYVAKLAPNQIINPIFQWFTWEQIQEIRDDLFPDCLQFLQQRLCPL